MNECPLCRTPSFQVSQGRPICYACENKGYKIPPQPAKKINEDGDTYEWVGPEESLMLASITPDTGYSVEDGPSFLASYVATNYKDSQSFWDVWGETLLKDAEITKKENKMNLKEELIDASSLVMVNQISKVAVESIKKLVDMAPRLSKNEKKILVKLLDTDLGRAACLMVMGTLLPQVPQFNNPRAAKLFSSIRLTSMALAGNDLVDGIIAPLLQKFTKGGGEDINSLMLLQDPGAALAYLETHSQMGGALKPFMEVLKKFQLVGEDTSKDSAQPVRVTQ